MREKVARRAGYRCEYCQAPQGICAYTFHVEHITPRSKGGANALENYALACLPCNLAKAAHLMGEDPETGREIRIFHPRRDRWRDHFAWSEDIFTIVGKTATGRATVEKLRMNDRKQIAARSLWQGTGAWP